MKLEKMNEYLVFQTNKREKVCADTLHIGYKYITFDERKNTSLERVVMFNQNTNLAVVDSHSDGSKVFDVCVFKQFGTHFESFQNAVSYDKSSFTYRIHADKLEVGGGGGNGGGNCYLRFYNEDSDSHLNERLVAAFKHDCVHKIKQSKKST